MKWIAAFVGTLLVVLVAVYALLFTAPGNGLVAPMIEKKAAEALNLPVRIDRFLLRPDRFEIRMELTPDNTVEAAANFSLFSRAVEAKYKASLLDLAALEPLTQQKLAEGFTTEGTVSGTLNALAVDGTSDIAGSETAYHLDLVDFSPASLNVEMAHARIGRLLTMTRQPAFAEGSIALDAKIAPLKADSMKGNVLLNITEGSIRTRVMKDEFNVTLPATDFTLNAKADLDPAAILYDLDLRSNLAKVRSKGNVSPKPFRADLTYDIRFDELAVLKPLTHAPLRGPFATDGSIRGDRRSLTIDGASDVADSQTTYHVELNDFQPAGVLAKVRKARLDKLLYLAGEDPLLYGRLNADITLDDLDPASLKGKVHAEIPDGKLNKTLLKKRYGLALPKTTLTARLDAGLNGKTVDYTFDLASSVANAKSKGSVVPATTGLDLTFALAVKELGLLQGVTGRPLRGPLAVAGKVKGDRKHLNVTGKSDIAKSDTSFRATLEAFRPKSAELTVENLQLDRLLYLLGEPHYASALIQMKAKLPSLESGKLDGTVRLDVTDGRADRRVVAKAFEWPYFKGATFAFTSKSDLKGDRITTKTKLVSDLIEYRSDNIVYDVAKGKLTSDFTATVPDFGRLYFLTEQKMRGKATLKGDLAYEKFLTLHASTKMLGGSVRAKFVDDKLHAELTGLETLDALHMLYYPEVFSSKLDGTFDYVTTTKKGVLNSKLSGGHFTRNVMFDLLRQYSSINLYEERFKGSLVSRIDNRLIRSDLDLRSNKSSIVSRGARLDTARKRIDARVDVNANNNPISVLVHGSLEDPKIDIDANKLIEREAGKQINRLFNDLFK